ncbi:MAG: hypothetical protein ACXWFI_05720 [Methylobacter sp.]
MSLILFLGTLTLGSWQDSQAQTGNTRGNTGSAGTMPKPSDSGNPSNSAPSDSMDNKHDNKNRKNTGSSNTNGKHRRKYEDTGAKGRDSSGMGSESGTGGVPR